MMDRERNTVYVGWGQQGGRHDRRPRRIESSAPLSTADRLALAEAQSVVDAFRTARRAGGTPGVDGMPGGREMLRAGAVRSRIQRQRKVADANPAPRPKLKRFKGSQEDLDRAVEAGIATIYAGRPADIGFAAEEIAIARNIRVDQVKQALHRLNLRGRVSQAHRQHAHDTNRNPMFPGAASGWAANIYYPRQPAIEALAAA